MKTQRAWLFLILPTLLLVATLSLVNTYNNAPIPTKVPASDKIEMPDGTFDFQGVVQVSLLDLTARMQLQPALTGFQKAQAGRDTATHFKLQNVAGGFM